jgi:putative heme transporter
LGRFEEVRANIRRAYNATRASVQAARQPSVDGYDPPEPAAPPSLPVAVEPTVASRDDESVPRPLRVAAAWSWRMLVIAAAAAVVLFVIGRLRQVLIPLSIALLLSALLAPAVGWLNRRVRLPRSLAVALVLVAGLAAVIGTLTAVITQFVNGLPELSKSAAAGIQKIQDWLRRGPLHLSNSQLGSAADAAQKWLDDHRALLTSGALSTATTAIDVLASILLVLFTTFFFLRDGRRIWRFVVLVVPPPAREPLHRAGEASWHTLVSYVRATVLVAFIDAVVPIVGATVSGAVAVLVALVTRDPITALAVLAAVIAVQQLEGHVLQPLIMGRAVAIHPLAVIVAIATGLVLAGIIGALVAVPVVAVLNTGVRHLIEHRHEPPPDAVVVSSRQT